MKTILYDIISFSTEDHLRRLAEDKEPLLSLASLSDVLQEIKFNRGNQLKRISS